MTRSSFLRNILLFCLRRLLTPKQKNPEKSLQKLCKETLPAQNAPPAPPNTSTSAIMMIRRPESVAFRASTHWYCCFLAFQRLLLWFSNLVSCAVFSCLLPHPCTACGIYYVHSIPCSVISHCHMQICHLGCAPTLYRLLVWLLCLGSTPHWTLSVGLLPFACLLAFCPFPHTGG